MNRVSKWITTVVVGIGLAGIAFLTILTLASGMEAKWALAAAGAATTLGLTGTIGSSWVSHVASAPPAGKNSQTVSHTRIRSGSAPAAGIMGDVYHNTEPSQKRKRGRSRS